MVVNTLDFCLNRSRDIVLLCNVNECPLANAVDKVPDRLSKSSNRREFEPH